jgi:transcriptional regulator with XRE-family HTH domain
MPRLDSDLDRTPGDAIRARRQQRGWSIRHAASRAGIDHSTWSRIERGERGTDNRIMLAKIGQALECAVTDLTGTPFVAAGDDADAAVYRTMTALIESDLDYPSDREVLPVDVLQRELDLIVALRLRCDYAGAVARLPDLIRGAHAAAAGPERAQALRLMCLATESAGFIVRYLGHPTSAAQITDRTRQAAVVSEDPVMLGLAAWAQSHSATSCGLYARAGQIAERGIRDLIGHTDLPESLEMLGQLHMLTGFSRYALGDQGGAAAAVAEAQQLAAHTGQSPALGLNFGPTNIQFWQISMEADGPEPERAVRMARSINPAEVPVTSRQTSFWLDMARAYANTKQDAQALTALLTAERLGPQRVRRSPIAMETLRALLERTRRNAVSPALRGLCERVGVQ